MKTAAAARKAPSVLVTESEREEGSVHLVGSNIVADHREAAAAAPVDAPPVGVGAFGPCRRVPGTAA
jgi:hypothetical protein